MVDSGQIARNIAEGGWSSIQSLVDHVLEIDPDYFSDYDEEEEFPCRDCDGLFYAGELDADDRCDHCAQQVEDELEEEKRLQIERGELEEEAEDE